jgi:hypothetical protein
MINQKHSAEVIREFLDETTTAQVAPNRRVINVVRFMVKVTQYITQREHEIYQAGVAFGVKAEREKRR